MPYGRCDLHLARKMYSQRSEEALEARLKVLPEQIEEPSPTSWDLAKNLGVKTKALLPILQKFLKEDDRYHTDGVYLYENK